MTDWRIDLGCGLLAVVLVAGCVDDERHVVEPDDAWPPDEPRAVYSVTGDGQVTLQWSPPRATDVDGYRVLISRDDVDYYPIVEVPAGQRHLVVHDALLPLSVPFRFVNGTTYWLGVQAVDWAGNTSELRTAVGDDTPRPAGGDLWLYDVAGPRRGESGYDFSRSPFGYAMDGTSLFADVYFTLDGGPWMRTAHPQVVEMQDMGFLDLDAPQVDRLPETGWLPAAGVSLRLGHVVLVRLWEETRPGNDVEPFHAAKFRVVDLAPDAVCIDWAYQIQPNSRELKPAALPARPAAPARRIVEVAS